MGQFLVGGGLLSDCSKMKAQSSEVLPGLGMGVAISWEVNLGCWLQCLHMACSYGLGSLRAWGLQAVELLVSVGKNKAKAKSPVLTQPWKSHRVTSTTFYWLQVSHTPAQYKVREQ